MIVGLDTALTQKAVTLLTVQSPQKSQITVLKQFLIMCSLWILKWVQVILLSDLGFEPTTIFHEQLLVSLTNTNESDGRPSSQKSGRVFIFILYGKILKLQTYSLLFLLLFTFTRLPSIFFTHFTKHCHPNVLSEGNVQQKLKDSELFISIPEGEFQDRDYFYLYSA